MPVRAIGGREVDLLVTRVMELSPADKFHAASVMCIAGRPEVALVFAQRAIEELELAALVKRGGK